MKAQYFLLFLISIYVSGMQASETELPQSVSVMMEYTGHVLTGDGKQTFELRDEDNDGVFTAELSLDKKDEGIYLLIRTTDSEGKTLTWGERDARRPILYGDVPYEVSLLRENEEVRIHKIELLNWKGGEMKVQPSAIADAL